MLKPRESDVPGLFLVLVVLPLVAYILLGKWYEAASKRKEERRIGLLAHLGVEESPRPEESMAAAVAIPARQAPLVSRPAPLVSPPAPLVSPPPKDALHSCSRCFAPATTRCSRCKSARYCSGKCQIIHWRIIHKEECRPVETINSFKQHALSEEPGSYNVLHNGNSNNRKQSLDSPPKKPAQETAFSDAKSPATTNPETPKCASPMMTPSSMTPKLRRKSSEKRVPRKTSGVLGREEMSVPCSSDEVSIGQATSTEMRNKENDLPKGQKVNSNNTNTKASRAQKAGSKEKTNVAAGQELGSKCLYSGPTHQVGNVPEGQSSSKAIPKGVSHESKSVHELLSTKSAKEQVQNVKERRTSQVHEERVGSVEGAYCPEAVNGTNNNPGSLKNASHKKSARSSRKDTMVTADDPKKVKVLFPYEEFMRLFKCEILDLTPRGLSNCGNSCYANAVLQCLTCTKPLVAYFLKRTHSRSCHVKSWCLMCELEQHVQKLRQSEGGGGAVSPIRILSNMRRLNNRMGNGSQEDAHEFLRLLVASMQSICLEESGGEKRVHPLAQETTFIQHTFGGRLRSRVKCLNCRHQSERCENFMDLTLEIFGWVESLEDALTQFTSPEDLDGDNMYKCGRCGSYVKARKQLSIDVAPNILTIVLKRFQKGSYGKLNKRIRFAETLDMIPYMTTGKYDDDDDDDVPSPYKLYGVVVHVDAFNASFTGHYVAYVKDLQGNWLRIDDSDIRLVPTSQVMSEGAYMLFYMRSCPRLSHGISQLKQYSSKAAAAAAATAYTKSFRPPPPSKTVPADPLPPPSSSVVYHKRSSSMDIFAGHPHPRSRDFDASSSSDWSIFTASSDEAASFTTESTRNSFSTTTADLPDPLRSFMSSLYHSENTNKNTKTNTSSMGTVSCRMFSGSKPLTRFAANNRRSNVFEDDASTMSVDNPASSDEVWPSPMYALVADDDRGNGFDDFVGYGSREKNRSRTNHKYY